MTTTEIRDYYRPFIDVEMFTDEVIPGQHKFKKGRNHSPDKNMHINISLYKGKLEIRESRWTVLFYDVVDSIEELDKVFEQLDLK